MLERSYEISQAHEEKPDTAENSSAVRVKDYRELVAAVLYLVSQGMEEGVIQLWDYAGDVEQDLSRACLEVAAEDPLGAYAVDYIKHEYTRVVSYYQATLSIRYRRTPEQVKSMVDITGAAAIRRQLQSALSQFQEEVVLRVSYFSGDVHSIESLLRQAYYDTPAAALGYPEAEVAFYPETGSRRVVEILLTYPEEGSVLKDKAAELSLLAEELTRELRGTQAEAVPHVAAQLLSERVVYDPAGPGDPYSALTGGRGDSEAMALAYALLFRRLSAGQASTACQVAQGTWQNGQGGEEARFWNVVTLPAEDPLCLDPTQEEPALCTEQEFFDLGFRWSGGPEDPPPEPSEAPPEDPAPEPTP